MGKGGKRGTSSLAQIGQPGRKLIYTYRTATALWRSTVWASPPWCICR